MKYEIKKITERDRPSIDKIIENWLADFIISRGRKLYPAKLDGFYAVDDNGKWLGFVTYEIRGDECEVVTLDAFEQYRGIGTALLSSVVEMVKQNRSISRLWLITTNDNLDAYRFYFRRGWRLKTVHCNALEQSRKLKPQIPTVGHYGIPMRDEVEFEYSLERDH